MRFRAAPAARHVMQLHVQPIEPSRPDPPSAEDLEILLAQARLLKRAAEAGQATPLLRGRHIGLLCESGQAVDALRFRRAAEDLGAHVAHVRPNLSEQGEARTLLETARLLGRLYDAVECQGLPSGLVRRLGGVAGVPVYDGVACANHPTAKLAGLIGDAKPDEDNRHWVVQAVLVGSIGRGQ